MQFFNEGIGSTHAIAPGWVRTYLPGVDPAMSEDAIRHRLLSRGRIEAEPARAARVIATLPRQLAAHSLPPAAVRGLGIALRDSAREIRTPDADIAALRKQVEVLDELLSIADGNIEQLTQTISYQQAVLLDLTDEVQIARDQIESREASISELRRRLVAAGRYDDAFHPVEEAPSLPSSFAEVLDRVLELAPYVTFTGSVDDCLDLDEQAFNASAAQLAWKALTALSDYARAKSEAGFQGDFKHWCECPPDGDYATIPAGKVARDESETVRNNGRFSRMRVLPVPVDVDPRGHAFMGAHIRLGNSSMVAPRMHYLDTGGKAIYVGYIGKHLPNTQT